jgi:hypothetical protein
VTNCRIIQFKAVAISAYHDELGNNHNLSAVTLPINVLHHSEQVKFIPHKLHLLINDKIRTIKILKNKKARYRNGLSIKKIASSIVKN